MTTTRKQYSPKFRARVAIEAIRGEKTIEALFLQNRSVTEPVLLQPLNLGATGLSENRRRSGRYLR